MIETTSCILKIVKVCFNVFLDLCVKVVSCRVVRSIEINVSFEVR